MLSRFMQSNRIPRALGTKLLASVYLAFPSDKQKGGFMRHHGRYDSTVLGRMIR